MNVNTIEFKTVSYMKGKEKNMAKMCEVQSML